MFKGKHVTLRGLELEDAEEILKYFNDLQVRQYLASPFPIAKEEEEEWIRSTWEARRQGREYHFGIEVNDQKKLIGACGLHHVNQINRCSGMGIVIWNKNYWGKKFGTEALHLLLKYGFFIVNLHSIFLTVIEGNDRAMRAYEKVGFQHTGRQRQAIFQDGQFKDLLMMDILKEEYRASYPSDDFFTTEKGE